MSTKTKTKATKKKVRANGEGTIRQRKDGIWEGLYTHNGKRKSVYGKTRDIVVAKLNKVLHDIRAGSYIENHSLTFGQWLDKWLKTYAKPNVRASTYASYETYIRGHVKPALGKIKLQNLSTDHLQEFLNEKQEDGSRLDGGKGGLSSKTILNLHRMIHLALKQACRIGLIKNNVADDVIKPKQIRREIDAFTVDEQERIVNACLKHRLGVGIILALYTGVRLGELLGLLWSDIDLDREIITIRQNLGRVPTPDDPNQKTKIIVGPPKTAKSQREIPIPIQDFLIPLMVKLRKTQCEERLLYGADYLNEGYVICNERGKHIEPRTYTDFFKKVLKEAGVPKTNFHVTRHTMATRALELGNDVKVVADILGHADASTTLNKYAHALPDHKRKSMDKFSIPLRAKI